MSLTICLLNLTFYLLVNGLHMFCSMAGISGVGGGRVYRVEVRQIGRRQWPPPPSYERAPRRIFLVYTLPVPLASYLRRSAICLG